MQLLSKLLGIEIDVTKPFIPQRSAPSEVQLRMQAKLDATAEQRENTKREIAEWNSKVVRRNKAFATTGKNKYLRKAA